MENRKVEKVVLNMSLRDFCQKYDETLKEHRKATGKPVRSFAELMELETAKLFIRI
jgi:hypothetical protein